MSNHNCIDEPLFRTETQSQRKYVPNQKKKRLICDKAARKMLRMAVNIAVLLCAI